MSRLLEVKAGPRYGYPRIRERISERLAVYAQLTRPFTVFSAWLAGLFIAYIVGLDAVRALLLSLMFASIQAAGQVVNQITDIEIDRIAKPYRPLPSGRATIREAWVLAVLYMLSTIGFSAALGSRAVLMAVIGLFLGLYYSLEPLRAKKRAWLNVLWQATARGAFPPLAASYIAWSRIPDYILALSVLVFLWVFAFQSTKDFPDVEADARYGVKTLPVIYGVDGARRVITWLALLYSLADGVMVGLGLVPPWMLLMALVAAFIPLAINVDSPTENNLAWNMFYGGIALHYLLYMIFY